MVQLSWIALDCLFAHFCFDKFWYYYNIWTVQQPGKDLTEPTTFEIQFGLLVWSRWLAFWIGLLDCKLCWSFHYSFLSCLAGGGSSPSPHPPPLLSLWNYSRWNISTWNHLCQLYYEWTADLMLHCKRTADWMLSLLICYELPPPPSHGRDGTRCCLSPKPHHLGQHPWLQSDTLAHCNAAFSFCSPVSERELLVTTTTSLPAQHQARAVQDAFWEGSFLCVIKCSATNWINWACVLFLPYWRFKS